MLELMNYMKGYIFIFELALGNNFPKPNPKKNLILNHYIKKKKDIINIQPIEKDKKNNPNISYSLNNLERI